jgi:RAB protein geranylgeranyltransferase component A
MVETVKAKKRNYISDHDMNDDGYDYIVLGTNLSENIVGAGLAISKHKCLFLDQADRYGGHLSNFSM